MANLTEKSNLELLRDVLKDPERKSIHLMVYELFILLIKYREMPVHYFSRYIFKKRTTNFKDFLPNKLSGTISVLINDHKIKDVLDNKLFFNFFYKQFDISLPVILMFNNRNIFVVENQTCEVNNYEEFSLLTADVFKKNPSVGSMIIKKTYASSSGKKIYKLSRDQVTKEPAVLKSIFDEVIRSGFLFQETIKQHPLMDKINPSCLNTIRIDTFINPGGKIDIGSAYLRMSINNGCIDNISSGGCQVGIKLNSGRLKKYGFSLLKTVGTEVYTAHPITKTIFEDFEIPYFQQVRELVIKTARVMPDLRLIGWDVAIGESGPLLIEGNSDYDISGNDLSDDGYMANPIFMKVLKEIKYRQM